MCYEHWYFVEFMLLFMILSIVLWATVFLFVFLSLIYDFLLHLWYLQYLVFEFEKEYVHCCCKKRLIIFVPMTFSMAFKWQSKVIAMVESPLIVKSHCPGWLISPPQFCIQSGVSCFSIYIQSCLLLPIHIMYVINSARLLIM